MFKKMKHMKNEKGLTLIELLAVIVILAIIAAIAIPAIGSIINTQRDKAILSDVSGAISAAKIAYADGSCSGTTCNGGELAFSSTKVGITSVNMATTVPTVTFTLTSGTTFNGSKIETALTAIDGSSPYQLTETQLNGILD